MTRLRRVRPLIAALALLAVAAGFAILAVDVRAWQSTLQRDDVRFSALHYQQGLWRSPAILPDDPAEHLLGLDSALAYRHVLQFFWLSQIGGTHVPEGSVTETRVSTENDLQAVADGANTAAERSNAANLLGVMTITTPFADSGTQVQTLERAEAYFRQAVEADPANYAPKANLELVLRLRRPAKTRFGVDAKTGLGTGGSHGSGVSGGGY
jgi:hypothetical protein